MHKEFDHLANAIYDHFKDARMYYEYAESAKQDGNTELAAWYMQKAKARLEMIGPDHEPVKRLVAGKTDTEAGYHGAVHGCMVHEVEELRKRVSGK